MEGEAVAAGAFSLVVVLVTHIEATEIFLLGLFFFLFQGLSSGDRCSSAIGL